MVTSAQAVEEIINQEDVDNAVFMIELAIIVDKFRYSVEWSWFCMEFWGDFALTESFVSERLYDRPKAIVKTVGYGYVEMSMYERRGGNLVDEVPF